MGDQLTFRARVSLGGLAPEDVQVELYLGTRGTLGGIEKENAVNMHVVGNEGDAYIYEVQISPFNSGRQDYVLRILPACDKIPNVLTPFFIRWEE